MVRQAWHVNDDNHVGRPTVVLPLPPSFSVFLSNKLSGAQSFELSESHTFLLILYKHTE